MKNKIISTILIITTLCLLIIVTPIDECNSDQSNSLDNIETRSNQVKRE